MIETDVGKRRPIQPALSRRYVSLSTSGFFNSVRFSRNNSFRFRDILRSGFYRLTAMCVALQPAQITETNLTEKFFTSFQIWMFARPKFRRRLSIRSLAPSTIRRRTIVPQTGFAMRRMHPDMSSDRRPSHRGRFKALVESFVNSANSVIEV